MKSLMLFFVVIFYFMLLSVQADESLNIKYNNVDLILSKPGIMSYSSFFDQVLSNPGVNVRVDSIARTLGLDNFYIIKEARTTYLVYNPKTNMINMSVRLQPYKRLCLSAIMFCATVFFSLIAILAVHFGGENAPVYPAMCAAVCFIFTIMTLGSCF